MRKLGDCSSPIKVLGRNNKLKLAPRDGHEVIAADQQSMLNPEMDQAKYIQVTLNNTSDNENMVNESCVDNEWYSFVELLNAKTCKETEPGDLDFGSDHRTSNYATTIPELSRAADRDPIVTRVLRRLMK